MKMCYYNNCLNLIIKVVILMARCIIITAYHTGNIKDSYVPMPGDFIICADAGYLLARQEGITPDAVLGDFDSMERSQVTCPDIIHVPVEKDDTDTLLCLKYGMELGYREFLMIGGIGGRLDHTMANIQTLLYAHNRGIDIEMADAGNTARILSPGTYHLKEKEGYQLSLFALTQTCTGIYYTGLKYPLNNATLTNDFPLGVSNSFVSSEAEITFATGTALLILSKD